MSTNYYLVNKKDKKIKQKLDKLVEQEIENIQVKLLEFENENDLEIEEEIKEKLSLFLNTLEWGLFEPEEIHICKTIGYSLIWQINQFYIDEESFIEYYEKNKEKYYIEDEYGNNYTMNEFLKKIKEGEKKEVKSISGEFF